MIRISIIISVACVLFSGGLLAQEDASNVSKAGKERHLNAESPTPQEKDDPTPSESILDKAGNPTQDKPTAAEAEDGYFQREKSPASFESFRQQYFAKRFKIGLRMSHFILDKTSKRRYNDQGEFIGGFLGSIDTLEEEQDYIPLPFVRYNINEYFGVEIGWDHYEIKTATYYDTSDGNFIYSGPTFMARGKYPNESIATPFVYLGWSMLSGEVDYNSEWHDNGRRNLYPDDTVAFNLGAGCELEIDENWAAEFGVKMVRADFDVEYRLAAEPRSRGDFNFPLDSTVFQLGATYSF